MARLTINDAFTTNLFQFNMQPPFRKMYQHNLQNGATALDMIAFKDKFEITFPYLSQVEYNRLTQYLESLTSPTFKIEYVTDEITRIWDSLTAYSINSMFFSGATPAFDMGMLISEQDTLNYFTTPSAEDGGVAKVSGETGLTITNDNTIAKFGSRSYKAVNSAASDWAFLGTGGNPVAGIGRPLWPTSGALLSEAVDTNYLLHTSDNPNLSPWNKVNVTATTSYPTTVTNTATNGYLEQVTNADATPGTTYTLSFNLTAIDPFGIGVVEIYVGDDTFSEYEKKECFFEGQHSISITFSAPTGTKVKAWFKPKATNGSWMTFTQPMLIAKAYERMTFIPTTSAEVSSTAMQAYLQLPFSTYHHQTHYPSLIYLGVNCKQSISCVFRAGGWQYNRNDDVQRTIISQVVDSGDEFSVYIIDGYLCVDNQYGNIGFFDCSAWTYQSWHSVTISCQYGSPTLGSDIQVWKMYVDFDTNNPITLDSWGYYPLFGAPGKQNCYMVVGANLDSDLVTQYNEFDGYISEIFLGPVEFDKISTGRSKSVIDIIKQAYSTTGDYNVNNLVLKNEEIGLFVRGNALNGYAARTIHFLANPGSTTMTLSGSAYVYPDDQTHYRIVGILGICAGRDMHYFSSEADNGYENNLKPFPFRQWTRAYVENQVCENTTLTGERKIFGFAIPAGSTFYFDGIQIEQQHASTTYCDGSQPNCSWSGVPNASTSSRGNQYTRLPLPSQVANQYDKDWTLLMRFQLPGVAINGSTRTNQFTEGYEALLFIGDGGASSTIGVRFIKTHEASSMETQQYIRLAITDENGDAISFDAAPYTFADVNARFLRDASNTFAVVYDKTAQRIYFYLNGVKVAQSGSLSNRHFKNPAYAYLGSTGQLNPTPLYSSMKIDAVAFFGTAIPPYNIMQIVTAMQDPDFIPPAAFLIYSFYDFNLSSLEATIGNSINEDAKRIRNRVFWTNMQDRAHFQNRANKYQIKLQFQEV